MVLADDLTWQLGDTGVTLNTDAVTPFVDIRTARGFDSAPFRTTQRDHEGDEGGYMDAEFERGRELLLLGRIISTPAGFEAYVDTLKENWAPSRVLVPLYFKSPGVDERFLYVKPLGVRYDWDEGRRLGISDVQFSAFAEDPRIYSNTLLAPSVGLGATILTGFGFPLGFSFGFGGTSSTTDQVTIEVAGNRPTPPVFIIQGPVTNPRILNDDTGAEMLFSPITLGSTDTLTVDVKNKTVKLNGTANRRDLLLAPTWFNLEAGTNHVRYRAESSDPASTLTIQYRPAWR